MEKLKPYLIGLMGSIAGTFIGLQIYPGNILGLIISGLIGFSIGYFLCVDVGRVVREIPYAFAKAKEILPSERLWGLKRIKWMGPLAAALWGVPISLGCYISYCYLPAGGYHGDFWVLSILGSLVIFLFYIAGLGTQGDVEEKGHDFAYAWHQWVGMTGMIFLFILQGIFLIPWLILNIVIAPFFSLLWLIEGVRILIAAVYQTTRLIIGSSAAIGAIAGFLVQWKTGCSLTTSLVSSALIFSVVCSSLVLIHRYFPIVSGTPRWRMPSLRRVQFRIFEWSGIE